MDISGLGIRVTVGKDRARLSFDKLMKVRETRRAFYLFLSANQAWILPKAQMEDPAGSPASSGPSSPPFSTPAAFACGGTDGAAV